jgi:hypothetical protein
MIAWIQGHMEMVVAILFALLSVSEVLALMPNVKANGIFQLVVGGLKKLYEFAKGKEKPAA